MSQRTMERRPLAAAINTIPNVDPSAVRQFVTQDSTTTPKAHGTGAAHESHPRMRSDQTPETQSSQPHPISQKPGKSTATAPIGLIPVTVRLRPEVAGALKRASLERQLAGEELFTQQQLVADALEPWLRRQGYLP